MTLRTCHNLSAPQSLYLERAITIGTLPYRVIVKISGFVAIKHLGQGLEQH